MANQKRTVNNPTAAQRRMWSQVAEIGCMACLQDGYHTQPEIHHVMELGGYRNHSKVFGLCPPHHKYTSAVPGILNRHKNPIEFAERFGTDQELHQKCMELIKGASKWEI